MELVQQQGLPCAVESFRRNFYPGQVARGQGPEFGTAQRAFAASPYRAVRAETTASERIGFWAHGEGFANGRGASVYGTEAGAALRLKKRMALTARFRMLGDGDGFDLSRLGVGVSAPLVGLALQF